MKVVVLYKARAHPQKFLKVNPMIHHTCIRTHRELPPLRAGGKQQNAVNPPYTSEQLTSHEPIENSDFQLEYISTSTGPESSESNENLNMKPVR